MAHGILRGLTKSQLEQVVRLATLKQHAAEQALKALKRAVLKRVVLSFAAGAGVAAAVTWWVLR